MNSESSKDKLLEELETLRQEIAELRAIETIHSQTREGLQAMEIQMASIIHSAMDGIITINEDQRIVFINSAAEKMFGCSGQHVMGQSLEQFLPERYRHNHKDHIKTFGNTNTTNRRMGSLGLIFGLRSSGEEFPLEASISQVDVGNKKLFTVILRDITERQKAEETLRHLKHQSELLLHAAGEGIYGLDLQGNTTFVNPVALEMLGWESHELIGQPQHALIHHTKPDGTPYPREECPIYRAFIDGVVHHVVDDVFWRKDGTSFPVEYISTPIVEDGELKGAVVTFKDVTERKRLEAHLSQTERLAEMGTLAAGMAHEIGTPMNVILGRAEYLMRKTSDESTKKGLATIVTQVERITRIMNQLLSFARRRPVDRRPLALGPVVHEMVEVVQERLERRGIKLELVLDSKCPKVLADRDQMSQVILNLVMNAIQAMPKGGTLTATLRYNKPHVNLAIADSGCGIPQDNIPKLFAPFFTTKEIGEGTGLGLTIVHGIVQEHEGSIFVESEPKKGATFTISLPVLDATRPLK